MVKLATARESRMYGPWGARNCWEYINAGLYVFATVILLGGFTAQLAGRGEAKSGLRMLLIGLALLAVINGHDLIAHLAGVDYCLALVVEYDAQLGLVEFAAPLAEMVGSVLNFLGILFLFIQAERGYGHNLGNHALNLLIAGPAFWVLGSVHDLCQVYHRADGHVQVLQKSVQIPFLFGSLFFLMGGIFNRHGVSGSIHHEFEIFDKSWVWLCIFGTLLFLVGGLMNVVKVLKMQQLDCLRLEKVRGGALERQIKEREDRIPPILEYSRRRQPGEEARPARSATSYKDVLLGQSYLKP